ncbi:MAG: hypothetical protein HYX83_01325 [Chloroflexi bacterium]|nr:hypothetical protein [Chloroflexota bacterium]
MPAGEIFGFVAGALVTLSLVPQIMRVFKLKSAREISIIFTSLMLAGILMWFVYGIFLRLIPLILWNTVGAVLTGILLFAKLKYGKS